ncbi:hypothetical protein [Actinacidiphila paucisporea]|uniref:Uncharacterized protein n=1 Tax=Actinacidiphila paucisporea TaxID=310782 RepID=A0A1M7QG88_9ACTN|nr:hypothetical protein [Actinacidiphila paucisporea]SHN29970.1 hypothetical protein SAMN05216499_13430 [Actinacidiphila paucisporea]
MPSFWRKLSALQRRGIAVVVLVCAPIVIVGTASGLRGSSGGGKAAASPSATSSTRKATPAGLSAPEPAHLAPAAARRKAAAICRTANAYYQTEFHDGVIAILNRSKPGSYPAFYAWHKRAANGDQQPWKDASAEVYGFFTAADAPSSVRDWYDDNGLLSADLAILAYLGLDAGGPRDAAAQQAVQDAVAHFREDFADAQKDADRIEAGK